MEEEERAVSESSASLEAQKEEEGMAGERKAAGGTTGAGTSLQLEIDNILEETARRKNLSVMNVKSILRVSVVMNKS